MTKRQIGGVCIDVVDRAQALAAIGERACTNTPLMLAFCNAHTVNMADADPGFAASLREAMVLNDGIGLDLGSRILHGKPFPDNLNGTDLTPAVLENAACPLRIFLVGSPEGVADQAAAALAARHPRHRVVGTQHGFFTESEEEALVDRILASGANLVLVGMGHPRQEMFAARHWRRIAGVTMCIGAFLDFTAGRVSRAPAWVRALRAEWVYRLAIEPRRMARRYLIGNVIFLKNRLAERRRA